MGIVVPDTPRQDDIVYYFIDGGNNGENEQPPGLTDARMIIARSITSNTGYYSAFILQIPNGNVRFTNDPTNQGRGGDKFMAWTWRTYIDKTDPHYKDPRIIARMPMTKGSTRGMDTVTDFLFKLTGKVIDRFAVGGASKRGWTAWSVAATDKRVVAVNPLVMSLLNFNDTLQSHFRNLGGWTFVFSDYWEQNLTQHFHDDDVTNWVDGLWNYEDMIRYKERLARIPKLLISACGDEFFLATDHPNWWDQMEGPKWLMMNPNAEHTLAPWYLKIGETISSWLLLTFEDSLPNVPTMVWLKGPTSNGGRILLSVSTLPDEIQAWSAHTFRNDTKKDFRLATNSPPFINPVVWNTIDVNNLGGGLFDVEITNDPPGFSGVFIDCVWTRLTGRRMHLTTEVQVTPDIYPFPPCYGIECWGELV
jgi:PhoPQ-activated pathogenicity-related protein